MSADVVCPAFDPEKHVIKDWAAWVRGRPVTLGTKTPWGKIVAMGIAGDKRHYWIVNEHGVGAMASANMVESKDSD